MQAVQLLTRPSQRILHPLAPRPLRRHPFPPAAPRLHLRLLRPDAHATWSYTRAVAGGGHGAGESVGAQESQVGEVSWLVKEGEGRTAWDGTRGKGKGREGRAGLMGAMDGFLVYR